MFKAGKPSIGDLILLFVFLGLAPLLSNKIIVKSFNNKKIVIIFDNNKIVC